MAFVILILLIQFFPQFIFIRQRYFSDWELEERYPVLERTIKWYYICFYSLSGVLFLPPIIFVICMIRIYPIFVLIGYAPIFYSLLDCGFALTTGLSADVDRYRGFTFTYDKDRKYSWVRYLQLLTIVAFIVWSVFFHPNLG